MEVVVVLGVVVGAVVSVVDGFPSPPQATGRSPRAKQNFGSE